MTDAAWTVFSLFNLDLIVMNPRWETIPFHFIWISLTLVYGFRTWKPGPTLWVLGGVMLLTAVGIGVAVRQGQEPPAELVEVPLMAMVFLAMAWHARRRLAAERSYQLIAAQIARILADQRRFLQDAAHQLRTPITIALGHAELLAGALASDQQEGADAAVVIGELTQLRRISDRLLIIAAAADPEFLHLEPVALDELVTELLRRWRPAASRRWRVGTLESVTVRADRERLALALDALIENAVRHTSSDDAIQLAVIGSAPDGPARLVVTDTGTGIAADQLAFIFDRFRTGDNGRSRGTGLGLPLVAAVAAAHGGTINVRSKPDEGSEFELLIPIADERPALLPVGTGRLSCPAGSHQGQVGGHVRYPRILPVEVSPHAQVAGLARVRDPQHSGDALARQLAAAPGRVRELTQLGVHLRMAHVRDLRGGLLDQDDPGRGLPSRPGQAEGCLRPPCRRRRGRRGRRRTRTRQRLSGPPDQGGQRTRPMARPAVSPRAGVSLPTSGPREEER
ncbi:MAG TPA: HAMP domain-containing sensor histidine kinase [Trebonia sp.]